MKTHFILAILAMSAVFVGAAQRQPSEARLQQMLRRFPGADLNKDGNLTLDEFREFRPRMQAGGTAGSARPAGTATNTPTRPATSVSAAGPVEIQITSDNPVPVNPRVYGIICEEMFVKDLVDEPEYISALTELKFKTFVYPGGSASYYHHPRGTGGFNIRPEEVRKSKHGDESRFMKEESGPDHFEQYMEFVKASGGEAVFTANLLNGTVAELEEFLSRLQAGRIPIACVVLGVEMHLGQAEALGLDGYIERIKPYIAMLQAKYPHVPIVAHSTPVGRVGDRVRASFHAWNHALAKLPGIGGFSQYGWPEFGTEVRRLMPDAAEQTPGERWRQYEEFTRMFPDRQLPAYQQDWGSDKKMYMLQWGTHLDRNTPVQGLHMANFYFFLAQYNAAHDDYFTVATSAPILAAIESEGARRSGVIYQDKIALFASYHYTKPFRHLFSGDKELLSTTVQGVEDKGKTKTVKAMAAVGPDGRKYLYVINSGPAVPLGKVVVDGNPLSADLPVEGESVFENPAADPFARVSAHGTTKTFMGVERLQGLMLEPWSLTLLILPMSGGEVSTRAEAGPNPAFADGEPGLEVRERQGPKKNHLAGLKLSWVEPDKTEPPGMTYKTFHSKTINREASYLIYLPPDYEKERQNHYPVLYWLHGSGAPQSKGGRIVKMVDQAIRDSKTPAIIIVLVNGLRGATMYCDTKDGKWPLESVIVDDLIPHIDATYRTIANREGRAIEGFSMGGFGAAHLGFKYPDLFGVVSILAPALLGPDIKADMPKRKWLEHFSFVFSEDIDYFHANDPFQLIQKNAERLRGRSVICLVPHDEEGKWLIPRCEELHTLLDKHKISHTFDVRTDVNGHNYSLLYDKMGENALGFYAKAFATAARTEDWTPAQQASASIEPTLKQQPAGQSTAAAAVEITAMVKPLTDMSAEDRYQGEDGGLYGGGRNSPPEAHFKAALAEAAKIQPLDADGKPSPNGKIVLMTHGMSNTTQESQRFIKVANADPLRNPAVVLVDGAQGGMDSRKWVEDTCTRSGASPWDRLEQRIKSAGATPPQVQAIWMKHALSLKNDARMRQFGGFPNYARQLQGDMAQLVVMLKKRYPNLRIIYVSSRSYGGYATTPLNPEPYAYESGFGVRWLIQEQIKGAEALSYAADKAPLLLWGPYLWADGEKGRKFDDLVYNREDFREDGTHPSDSGQQKIAEQLLKFFQTDTTAKTWFAKH